MNNEEIIFDVDKRAGLALKKYYLFFFFALCAGGFLTYLLWNTLDHDNDLIFLPLIICFILIAGVVQHLKSKYRTMLMKQFAAKNSFSFVDQGSVAGKLSLVLAHGNNDKTFNIIQGKIKDRDFELFNFSIVIGSGKHKKISHLTVMEITLEGHVPEFTLEEKKHRMSGVSFCKEEQKKLELEGDFHKQFTVYATQKQEIEVLEVLTPEVMVSLQTRAHDLSFEFFENKIFIYQDHFIHTKKEIEEFFDLANYLIELTGYRLSRLHDDMRAWHAVAK